MSGRSAFGANPEIRPTALPACACAHADRSLGYLPETVEKCRSVPLRVAAKKTKSEIDKATLLAISYRRPPGVRADVLEREIDGNQVADSH